MPRPYSMDLRDRAVARVAAGETVRSVVAILEVSVASVVKWSRRFRRSSHKGAAVRTAIRAAGARLVFLPPCSPDLNPIGQVFAKLKHPMRKAAERTVEATWKRSGELLDHFKPDECRQYLRNSGYASS